MSGSAHKYLVFSPPKSNIAKYFGISLVALLPSIAVIHQTWHLPLWAIGQSVLFFFVASLVTIFILPVDKAPFRFGAANCVTLLRLIITAILASTIGFLHLIPETGLWWLTALGASGFMLDGVDGWIARSLSLESKFGARFDMEVDAGSILVLSLIVGGLPHIGPWVLIAGLLRYVFVAASWPFPSLRAPLPPSFRRKFICVLQISVLILALCPLTSPEVGRSAVAIAVVLLLLSFLRDALQLMNATKSQGD
jgi:phosphatidylglycerophosphate synthase